MEIREILRDFQRRWDHGYVWVEHPDSQEESLFLVNNIREDRTKIATIELSSPEYGKILLNMGTAHTIKFKYPPVGVFQNGKDAFLFRRYPAKQYKHAICNTNSVVAPVYTAMLGNSIRLSDNQLKFDDVLAAYKGERYMFGDALKMLSSGKYRSVALQRNWSLCLNPMGRDGFVLLFWETPVAIVSAEGTVLHMMDKSFEPVMKQVKEA